MDARVGTLEQSVARIDATLSTLATKGEMEGLRADFERMRADVVTSISAGSVEAQKSLHDQLKWIVGTAIALGAALISVMGFMINQLPKPPAAQPAPIVITIPSVVPAQAASR